MDNRENKKLCYHRVHHIVNDIDYGGDTDFYPCEYMINHSINKYSIYSVEELEPYEEFCLECPYRNKDMGENFEVDSDLYREEYEKHKNLIMLNLN